jgi:uncharacterized membrane protein YesL
VPANLVWGAALLATLFAASYWAPALLLLGPALALPTAGLFRLAALIARVDAVALRDAFVAWRAYARDALLTGTVLAVVTVVFLTNVAIGLSLRNIFGGVLAATAGWGLFVLLTAAVTFWPLLVDPRRAGMSLRDKVRLAAALVIAFPIRLGALVLLIALVLVLSTIFFAALVTVSVAFVALVASRYVLPAADRFEGRATELVLE